MSKQEFMKEEKTLKKFLSVLLTMAMVMTLFTGTVLAASTLTGVTLSKSTIVEAVDTEIKVTVTTSGTPSSVSWAIIKGATYDPNNILESGTAGLVNNEFYLNVSRLTAGTGEVEQGYTIFVEDDNTGVVAASKYASITVRHAMTVNGSTAVPVVNLNEAVAFEGVITNGKDLYVALLQGGTVVASMQANASGEFVLNRTFTDADLYSIGVRKGASGVFTPYLNIDFTPKSDTKINNTTVPTATRDADTAAFKTLVTVAPVANGAALPAEKNTFVEMTLPNGDKVKMDIDPGATVHEYSYTFAIGTLKAGTYTITAVTYNADVSGKAKLADIKRADGFVTLRKAEGSFTVADNANNMVVTVRPGEKPAGAFVAGLGVTSGAFDQVVPTVAANSQAVEVVVSAPATKTIAKVVYTVKGPIKSSISRTSAAADITAGLGNTFTRVESFDITHGGTITVAGTVTYDDKSTEEFEKTVKANGYVVEFNEYELGKVGDEIELKAVIKTTAGVPVNNKEVIWEPSTPAFYSYNATDKVYSTTLTALGNTKVNGAATNIQDGTYSLKVKLGAFSTVTMRAMNGGLVYAEADAVIYGDSVYTAEVTGQLVATVAGQKLTVAMYNANGTKITPNKIQIDELGKNIVNEASFTDLTISDSKITFNPLTTGTFNLMLGTDSGNKMVVVPVTVVAPELASVTINDKESTTVTAGLREKVVVTFENITTGTLTFTNTNVYDANKTVNDIGIYTSATAVAPIAPGGTIAIANKVATFYVDAIAKRGEESKIAVKAKADLAAANAVTVTTLKIVPIVVDTDDVKSLVVDANVDLYLTVTDARGNALEGLTVSIATTAGNLAGNNTAVTDANGKAVLNVKPVSVGTVTLAVGDGTNTYDVEYYVDKNNATLFSDVVVSLPVGRDVTGPVIHLEDVYTTSSSSYTVSFQVTDTSKIAEVWVNDEKALVRPDNTVRFTISGLVTGVNEFEVLAYDVEGNGTIATLVIEYLKPAKVELTIGSTEATKDGAPIIGMDQAPVIKNGRTFLPVRFVLQNLLGGSMEWDASTQTITSVVNGNTIKMVIGSKTAYVNGNVVALLEAPYIEAASGRTLVPLREIMEAIGISLEWNAATQTVTIVIPQ